MIRTTFHKENGHINTEIEVFGVDNADRPEADRREEAIKVLSIVNQDGWSDFAKTIENALMALSISAAADAKKSASSALEEKEIINAKKAELKRIIETVSEKLEKTYELQKAVWIGRSEAAGGLSMVKKVSDDIIEWMGKNKKGINTKPLKDFSDSLKVIIIIEELEYLALILKIPPPIIDRALEEIKSAKDKSQNMEKLKKLVYEIETIMQEAKEKLEEISVSLGISSPISEEIQKLLTELEQEIADFSHYALAEPPKSNQEVPILDAKLGKYFGRKK